MHACCTWIGRWRDILRPKGKARRTDGVKEAEAETEVFATRHFRKSFPAALQKKHVENNPASKTTYSRPYRLRTKLIIKVYATCVVYNIYAYVYVYVTKIRTAIHARPGTDVSLCTDRFKSNTTSSSPSERINSLCWLRAFAFITHRAYGEIQPSRTHDVESSWHALTTTRWRVNSTGNALRYYHELRLSTYVYVCTYNRHVSSVLFSFFFPA